MSQNSALLDLLLEMQDGLIAQATGGDFPADFASGDSRYSELRQELLNTPAIAGMLPDFIRRCRDLHQFWQFIKHADGTYAGRRHIIWEAFRPALDNLEAAARAPGDAIIAATLERFDPANVHAIWTKALSRRTVDPEGAITAARTLLESTCKHILDDAGVTYSDKADLPKLWGLAAEQLNLAPAQHQEEVFRTILGSCQQVVNSLATVRNKIGDAHGQGKLPVKPLPRHAELAVGLAGVMATFLVETYEDRKVGRRSPV